MSRVEALGVLSEFTYSFHKEGQDSLSFTLSHQALDFETNEPYHNACKLDGHGENDLGFEIFGEIDDTRSVLRAYFLV